MDGFTVSASFASKSITRCLYIFLHNLFATILVNSNDDAAIKSTQVKHCTVHIMHIHTSEESRKKNTNILNVFWRGVDGFSILIYAT